MNNEGLLLIISGPTGAGKDKIIEAFLNEHKDWYMPVSYTTRDIKEGEEEGIDFHYVTNQDFFKKVEQGIFLEWGEVYGEYYGTPKHALLKRIKEGKNAIVEVDPRGAFKIKESYKDAILIFILPNSIEDMKKNILESKKDTPENLLRKFNSAYKGIQEICKYNYGVMNTSVEEALLQIDNIIKAEECRVQRVMKTIDL